MIYEALRGIDRVGIRGASKIRIGVAKDGSGVGAALIALVAANMEKKSPNGYFETIKNEVVDKVKSIVPDIGASTTLA